MDMHELVVEWIKVFALLSGVVVGGFAVLSPAWVWLKKQLLTSTACWLAAIGCVMASSSIWTSVEVEGPGIKARIAELQNQNKKILARFDTADENARLLAAQGQEKAIRNSYPVPASLERIEIQPRRPLSTDFIELMREQSLEESENGMEDSRAEPRSPRNATIVTP